MNPIIIDEHTGARLWRAVECAEHCGLAASTWHSYTRKKMPPDPVAHFDSRIPLWDAEQVKHWHANRPGSPVKNHPTRHERSRD